MCRFALITSKDSVQPEKFLSAFADMSRNSPALDGDAQRDGWGIAWLDENDMWQVHKSLLPIWEDRDTFKTLPASKRFAMHARSASFPNHKDNILYNQPYISDEYAFVFNGLLKGVSLPTPVPGTIGAEKIWNLLQEKLKEKSPDDALSEIKELLVTHSREINALNIGLMTRTSMHSLNYFTHSPEYYKLHKSETDELSIISSQPLAIT